MKLTTRYLGLTLAHPFMPGASPLVDDIDTVNKGDRAFKDHRRDRLHLLGPGIPGEDVPREVDGEQHGDDAGRQDDQLERTRIHRGFRLLLDKG